MIRTAPLFAAALLLALSGAALAGKTLSGAERLELARANAGEPVKRVRFVPAHPAESWEVFDDQHILVWQNHTKAYLVTLEEAPGCRDLDKEVSMVIETLSDSLNTTNGWVRTKSGTCNMVEIRKVDASAFRAAETAAIAARGQGG